MIEQPFLRQSESLAMEEGREVTKGHIKVYFEDRSKKFKLFPGNLTMSKNKTQKYVCNYKNVQHLTQ